MLSEVLHKLDFDKYIDVDNASDGDRINPKNIYPKN